MGLYYDDRIEEQMTSIVKKAINGQGQGVGNRQKLADKVHLDPAIIEDIADRRAYQLTIPAFERIFGVKLKRPDLEPEVKPEEKRVLKEVDVDIRCPGFEEMKRLIERTGRKVRIVYAG